jgi:hypothetical protein
VRPLTTFRWAKLHQSLALTRISTESDFTVNLARNLRLSGPSRNGKGDQRSWWKGTGRWACACDSTPSCACPSTTFQVVPLPRWGRTYVHCELAQFSADFSLSGHIHHNHPAPGRRAGVAAALGQLGLWWQAARGAAEVGGDDPHWSLHDGRASRRARPHLCRRLPRRDQQQGTCQSKGGTKAHAFAITAGHAAALGRASAPVRKC